MKTIAAEGVWCKECEYFEEPDFDGEKCLACGCTVGNHTKAEVVIDELAEVTP